MLKQIAKISFLSLLLTAVPSFADDLELFPEAIPGDNDQPQRESSRPPINPPHVVAKSPIFASPVPAEPVKQLPLANKNERFLSPDEARIIQQAQAQFEAELNSLPPMEKNDAASVKNDAPQRTTTRSPLHAELSNKRTIQMSPAEVKLEHKTKAASSSATPLDNTYSNYTRNEDVKAAPERSPQQAELNNKRVPVDTTRNAANDDGAAEAGLDMQSLPQYSSNAPADQPPTDDGITGPGMPEQSDMQRDAMPPEPTQPSARDW